MATDVTSVDDRVDDRLEDRGERCPAGGNPAFQMNIFRGNITVQMNEPMAAKLWELLDDFDKLDPAEYSLKTQMGKILDARERRRGEMSTLDRGDRFGG